jgi:hypothetical protein
MRIYRVITAAAFAIAIMAPSAAGAFETTQIGGTNSDGSAQYQDPDDQKLQAPLGSVKVITGSGFNDNGSATQGWSAAPQASGFSGWPYEAPLTRRH